MGAILLKQPNGKFTIFSTVDDQIKGFDLSEQDVIDIQRDAAAERAEEEARRRIDRLNEETDSLSKFHEAIAKHRKHEINTNDPEWKKRVSDWAKQFDVKYPSPFDDI